MHILWPFNVKISYKILIFRWNLQLHFQAFNSIIYVYISFLYNSLFFIIYCYLIDILQVFLNSRVNSGFILFLYILTIYYNYYYLGYLCKDHKNVIHGIYSFLSWFFPKIKIIQDKIIFVYLNNYFLF